MVFSVLGLCCYQYYQRRTTAAGMPAGSIMVVKHGMKRHRQAQENVHVQRVPIEYLAHIIINIQASLRQQENR